MSLLPFVLASCSSDGGDTDSSTRPLDGTTPCEKWESLSSRAGCAPPDSCDVSAACNDTANAWIECAATDMDQCLCETDLDLNCEGSWKAGEGPALCASEYNAFSACVDANP